MASGHVNRIKRPNTWLHRPMLQNVKKALANPEPSTHGYKVRDAGIAVAGIVQHNRFIRDRTRCDMEVEELASGIVLKLSEDRGKEARGCRLDRGALSEAAALLSASIESGPQLVILNKFGKTEAEGRGLRDTLAQAVQLGVPVIVGVPFRNIEQWRNFAEGLAEECAIGSSRPYEWLLLHGFNSRESNAGAPVVNTAPFRIQPRCHSAARIEAATPFQGLGIGVVAVGMTSPLAANAADHSGEATDEVSYPSVFILWRMKLTRFYGLIV